MFKALRKLFAKPTPATTNMAQARHMLRVAREDKAAGYHCAAKAAVQSALSYRAAHHAARFYAVR